MSDYVAVALITFGIALFSLAKAPKPAVHADMSDEADDGFGPQLRQLFGILLVCANIMLDGFTNHEQDRINKVILK